MKILLPSKSLIKERQGRLRKEKQKIKKRKGKKKRAKELALTKGKPYTYKTNAI